MIPKINVQLCEKQQKQACNCSRFIHFVNITKTAKFLNSLETGNLQYLLQC